LFWNMSWFRCPNIGRRRSGDSKKVEQKGNTYTVWKLKDIKGKRKGENQNFSKRGMSLDRCKNWSSVGCRRGRDDQTKDKVQSTIHGNWKPWLECELGAYQPGNGFSVWGKGGG